MKFIHRSGAIAASIAITLLSACQSAPAPAPPPAPVSDEAGVHAWLDSFQKAVVAKDINAVMALYTPDVRAYDIVPPLQYVGADAYRKDYQELFTGFPGPLTVEFSDVHVQTTGDLAIIECLQHITAIDAKKKKTEFWSRVTTGLRKQDGKWLDFHDHASVPVDLMTGKPAMYLKP